MTQDVKNNKSNIEDIYELTPMQQGMLYHTLYTEGSDVYIEQFIYSLTGNLDKALFKKAWKQVISRHAALRTSFQWKGISKPVQLVNKNIDLIWKDTDWSKLNSAEQESEFNKFVKADRINVFSLEKPPLMRFNLIDIGNQNHKFVWTFHHILMDGWSYPVIQKEVFEIYKNLKENKDTELPRPASFKEYILWLNQKNQKEKASADNFWKKELAGIYSPTPMPADYSSIEKVSEEISELGIKLSPEITSGLQDLARNNQITLNTIIQGAWAFILSTYRGEDDVIFGGTVSGRNPELKGIEKMVGMFINTLPVRIKINNNKFIKDWLKEIQEGHIERDQYSYSSLVDIQNCSQMTSGEKLFNNILVFENYPLDKSFENGIAGIKITDAYANERTNFPLTILTAPGESLGINILYHTSKFSEKTIQNILENFEELFRSILKNAEGKVSDLSVMSENETYRILFDWNDTYKEFPIEKSVHKLFEEQVEKNPEKVAVEFCDKTFTYLELNEKANQIANYLIKLGAKPGVLSGICIERSFEMLTALLGILKSGCAYVPMDPTYPEERLNFMTEDCDLPFILTSSKIAGKLPKTKAKLVMLDQDFELISKESKENPNIKLTPESLAYVIYTSGSTGKPKGVLMKHEALSNLLYWQFHSHKFEKGLRVLQFTSLSFDVSFQEIFSTWLSGSTLILMTDTERQDLSEVLRIISEKKIQRMFLPFIALQEIAELYGISKDKKLYLEEVITAGEQLQSTPAIISLFKDLEKFTFSNHYGPSEAHVVTSYTLNNDPDKWEKLPPVGKPVFNAQMYILNSALKPVPAGVPGDLYIGGKCLVKGYHNREDLTKEKFIDNPFYDNSRKGSGKKIYRTGDKARYLPDGNIEYLGRTDRQIKLRGIRIELGEIETMLSEYPGIKSATVITKKSASGDNRLVAYFVPVEFNSDKSEHSELKKYLSARLPEVMVPNIYIQLEEMPLTATGKIDQSGLPSPESGMVNEKENYCEPKDELQLQLVKIWEKVLGVQKIGIRDNYFDLGGHSLLAVRLIGYIEKLTGKKLPLSSFVTSPTIEQQSEILKNDGWKPSWKSLVAIKPGGSKIPFFCVPPASGSAIHFQEMVQYIPDDQPMYILEPIGLDGKEPPHYTIKEMATFYVKEVQSMQPEGPYLLGGRCFGGRVIYEMGQQLCRLGQKVQLLAIFDTWPPHTAKPRKRAPEKKGAGHFLTSAFRHLRSGELFKVIKRFTSNRYAKFKWYAENKIEYIFSNDEDRLFKEIMLMHLRAQDDYIATKYPGKITLIECGTFKDEYREGWRNLAEGGLESYPIPGTDHKNIVSGPNLKRFTEKLNIVLEKAHKEIEELNSDDSIQSDVNDHNSKKVKEEQDSLV
ncbi:MAG TPA: amino acid adenylation domain-containing protein [Ignavibacteria bacterium]|nr:amino acid adenylation domain-containing protein [Ignavibacteria bacterium]HMR40462.1 amino acid adenylation domain-containing protein [Ignavibacteria bacterium]